MSLITFGELRAAVKAIRGISSLKLRRGEYYRPDRWFTGQYPLFADSSFKDWKKEILLYLDTLKRNEVESLYVDVCGRASAKGFGVAKNYSYSLQPRRRFEKDNDGSFEGDVFSVRTFGEFVSHLERNGHCPSLVTFFPVAGLWEYSAGFNLAKSLKDRLLLIILAKNFKRMFKLLRPGGFIVFDKPFQSMGVREFLQGVPQGEQELVSYVKMMCSCLRCSLRVKTSPFGPHFLVRKYLR